MKLPEFMRKEHKVKPHKAALIETVAQARKHITGQGGTIEPDSPFEREPRHLITFRGFSHGGVPDAGLIHIADEDARAVARKRVKKDTK